MPRKTSNIGYYSPLYKYDQNANDIQKDLLNPHPKLLSKTENLSAEFRQWIDEYYQHHYIPKEILGYIYTILHSPTYRIKYFEFLNGDFPRIHFLENHGYFKELSSMGWEVIQSHLMKLVSPINFGSYMGQGTDIVSKVSYNPDSQELFINLTQYFSGAPRDVWEFCIGGYQVLDKYLKFRKGRTLNFEEIEHFEKVTNILALTIQKMSKIDEIYKKIDQEN